jgi:hypothetical protein
MKLSDQEAAYEAARMWAVSPVSHPPSGWAQLLRGGLVSFLRETHAPIVSVSLSPQSTRLSVSPLSILVAAMITEVCR